MHVKATKIEVRVEGYLLDEEKVKAQKNLKGTDRLCKIVKQSMQCCGQIL